MSTTCHFPGCGHALTPMEGAIWSIKGHELHVCHACHSKLILKRLAEAKGLTFIKFRAQDERLPEVVPGTVEDLDAEVASRITPAQRRAETFYTWECSIEEKYRVDGSELWVCEACLKHPDNAGKCPCKQAHPKCARRPKTCNPDGSKKHTYKFKHATGRRTYYGCLYYAELARQLHAISGRWPEHVLKYE